jgi:hypothetical protein
MSGGAAQTVLWLRVGGEGAWLRIGCGQAAANQMGDWNRQATRIGSVERFGGGAGYPFKPGWTRESDLSVWAETLCLDRNL